MQERLSLVAEPNLRFPAVFCENLRFSAKICGFLRSKSLNFQEKGVNLRKSRFATKYTFWVWSGTLDPSPQTHPGPRH